MNLHNPIDVRTVAVVIVGGGPAGLRAAAELAPRVSGQVLVLEREAVAGGIPRHSDHPGYGIRDMGKFVSGPRYAEILRTRAVDAGAHILTNATVTGWAGPRAVEVTAPTGRFIVEAGAVILATGARERPRAARLIPGDRSAGVYTTGQLQNIVHLKHGRVGRRAVVVGSELVSWSAVLTLRHAGCKTVLMTTEYPRSDSYAMFHRVGRALFRTTVTPRTRVTRIIGKPHVTAVEVEDMTTGRRHTVDCDTVILTGDWIPDNELARAAGIAVDKASKAPIADSALRTGAAGVFAVGNVLHPVDTADIAALDGAAVADHVLAYLAGADDAGRTVGLTTTGSLRWIAPRVLSENTPAPPRARLLLWSDKFVPFPVVIVRQDGREIARRRLPWPAAPGRVFRVPSNLLGAVDWNGGDITVGLAE